jgi:hypothetical protein
MLDAAREIPDVSDLRRFGRDEARELCISPCGVNGSGEVLMP